MFNYMRRCRICGKIVRFTHKVRTSRVVCAKCQMNKKKVELGPVSDLLK